MGTRSQAGTYASDTHRHSGAQSLMTVFGSAPGGWWCSLGRCGCRPPTRARCPRGSSRGRGAALARPPQAAGCAGSSAAPGAPAQRCLTVTRRWARAAHNGTRGSQRCPCGVWRKGEAGFGVRTTSPLFRVANRSRDMTEAAIKARHGDGHRTTEHQRLVQCSSSKEHICGGSLGIGGEGGGPCQSTGHRLQCI